MIMNLKGLSDEKTKELFTDGNNNPLNIVLSGYRGSIAHGTYLPSNKPNSTDDKDVMGIFIAPKNHYLGFGKREVYERQVQEWDIILYELRKFVGLLLKCNPNVMMMLWLPEKYYLSRNKYGQLLIDNRDIFVSKHAYHSFSGYAYGQFKRMTHFKFEGYMGEKRKKLVEKFGFDCKNGAHLIRLLKMGIEFLTEGVLYVEREDAPQLISIKNGEWTLEQVKREAEKLFGLAEQAYIHSTLKDKPDYNRAEELLMRILEDNFNETSSKD
ncbi:hypothetical protein A2Z67_05000 [Candidatus Woesebacteria bacterium RBG_13_36_22]|uniref:Nucleotidyltransferase n=1 Tax=Candidatus Woesebacteria bacterium RBG_13_36_22 TaxID=1802478 RepID=A0A1F7X3J8_9BACT|nr:MAG: hypothetical protein A2Z67_05000 [Candidatus Woesebacteria bacterium RBG_13_36_22]